jgi:hypothetical protein
MQNEEALALVRDRHLIPAAALDGYAFDRIQTGYEDGVPRAVFVHADAEPIGVPLVPMGLNLMLMAFAVRVSMSTSRRAALESLADLVRGWKWRPGATGSVWPAIDALRATLTTPEQKAAMEVVDAAMDGRLGEMAEALEAIDGPERL